MASEFDEFMAAGFEETCEVIGTVNIRCGQLTKGCVAGAFVATKEQRETGYWDDVTTTVELSRANYVALGIVDRAFVTLASRSMQVKRIEDDPHDPGVRLYLTPDHS